MRRGRSASHRSMSICALPRPGNSRSTRRTGQATRCSRAWLSICKNSGHVPSSLRRAEVIRCVCRKVATASIPGFRALAAAGRIRRRSLAGVTLNLFATFIVELSEYLADARVQDLSMCPYFAGWYRAHAHHSERADAKQQ